MLEELVVVNVPRKKERNLLPKLHAQQGLQWQTCLRKVVLLNRTMPVIYPSDSSLEIYQAEHAYQFLLETICGLHSPLLGETEVLGQFREFCFSTRFPQNAWGQFLRQLTTELLTDAKRIRQQHLQNLGSHSYGSLARQALKGFPVIAVLGAGQLVQELLPWLTQHAEVRVFARNPQRAADSLGEQASITIADLHSRASEWDSDKNGLIVAAPLTATEIKAWVEMQGTAFAKTLDLRGESAHDPLTLAGEVIGLADFFASLESERQHAEQRATAARTAIAQLAARQLRQLQCRPYGWEDLCA